MSTTRLHRVPPWRRALRGFGALASMAASLLLVAPPALGWTGYTVVSGRSMEPTYHTGDLVLTVRVTPRIGDVIVYRVPDGEPGAGAQVIHRVTGGDGERGWVTRGDNRDSPDIWRPRNPDVVGRVVALVPRGGRLLAVALDPGTLAMVAVALGVWAIWPRREEAAGHADGEPVAT